MKTIKPGNEVLFRFYADSLLRLYTMRGEAEVRAILQGTDEEVGTISLLCAKVITELEDLVEEQPGDN